MTQLIMGRDKHSSQTGSFFISGSGNYVTLGALGKANIAIPANTHFVVIEVSYNKTVLVGTSDPAYSASGTFAAGDFRIAPCKLSVTGNGSETLYLQAIDADSVVQVSFYEG